VRAYEVMVILEPSLEERTIEPSLDKYLNVIRKDGGNVESVDVWGRRRLAYEIDHKAEGSYHLLTLQADPGTLDEIARVLKITDGVLRHMAVKRPKAGATPSGPPPSTDREPQYAESFAESGAGSEPAAEHESSGARLQSGSGEPEEE
jgi:small subunit ribosomal protein S6